MRALLGAVAVLAGCFAKPAPPAAAPHAIAYVQSIAHDRFQDGQSDHAFALQAASAGDAVVLHVTCESGATSTLVFTVAAPGWTFDELGPSTFSEQVAFDSFGAIAPDTAAATVTVTSSAPCDVVLLGDELTGNDRTGGKTTFDAHVIASGNGDCVDQIQIGHDDDAVWSACWTAGNVIDLGGFDAGAYSTGDAAGYQITEAPASTVVATHFSTSSAMDRFVMTTVSIKPG